MQSFTVTHTVGSLLHINLNSNVMITNSVLCGNESFKNGYSVTKSIIQVNNVVLTGNNLMQDMLHLISGSSAIIQNNTFTKNNVSSAIYKLCSMSTIQLHSTAFM